MDLDRVDLSGKICLVAEGGRHNPIFTGYWGHCQINNSLEQYSYRITFSEVAKLVPGECTSANLRFKFGTINELGITIKIGDELQLNEGRRNIGSLKVSKIYFH